MFLNQVVISVEALMFIFGVAFLIDAHFENKLGWFTTVLKETLLLVLFCQSFKLESLHARSITLNGPNLHHYIFIIS